MVLCCLGAGTLSIPFLFYKNGLVVGSLLLIFAAYISSFCGLLITECCEKYDATRYEDIAMATYGKRATRITSISMLACLLGFCISYIILLKKLLPFIIAQLSKGKAPAVLIE